MSAKSLWPKRTRDAQVIDGESRVVQGPWENTQKVRPAREPIFKRGRREPIINSWRGLAICAFLLFVAPPLAGWAGRILMHMFFGSAGR
ncbi:hypothetical protein [Caulobacter sp. S45]|jgi:hypothetical protein|uniref:hypothetical protein n=1 Tax=Caulobacter sp. S45 TaxID=1641861 RepID=UPI00131C8760|nr:hypothetical protein [Caulobacter sp. S45]